MSEGPFFKKDNYGTKISIPVFPYADLCTLVNSVCDLANECQDGEASIRLAEKLEHAAKVIREKAGK